MTSHYEPPRTRAEDPGTAARPRSIKLSMLLTGLLVLVEFYQQLIHLREIGNGEISGLAWIVDWFWVAAIALTGIFIAHRRNWARWVLGIVTLHLIYELVHAGLFISSLGPDISRSTDPLSPWILSLSALLGVAATILNFGPDRAWFR